MRTYGEEHSDCAEQEENLRAVDRTVKELEHLLSLEDSNRRKLTEMKLKLLKVMRERNVYLEKLQSVEKLVENLSRDNADLKNQSMGDSLSTLLHAVRHVLYSEVPNPFVESLVEINDRSQ